MFKIFISYRSLDSVKVDAIVARLRSLRNEDGTARYKVWQDKDGIRPGHDWWEEIVEAIIDCNVFVFMVSRESVNNINCRAELSYARKRNRPIIPFILEGEYQYNRVSGKFDVEYSDSIPQGIVDLRAQYLFHQGAAFLPQLEQAFARIQSEPQRWLDLPAARPSDPRDISDETNNSIAIYDQACDYAWRLEIATAERMFQRLVNANDPDFGADAHAWIVILRGYQDILSLDARKSTRYRVKSRWESYLKHFPTPFIEGIFDPKGFETRINGSSEPDPITVVVAPPVIKLPSPPPAPARPRSIDLLLAPFAWIDLPGTKGKTWKGAPYKIAKYPVTNSQFRLFVDAGGYQERQWWTDAGWEAKAKGWVWKVEKFIETGTAWAEPRYWSDSRWNGAEQPVVGISWYEAVAFCQWLSDAAGERIMLPTEDQWQYAAQGDDGRDYPWGSEWDCKKCNNSVSPCNSKATTSVRTYEGIGDSPFGVVDMAGNVWEWCLTDYNNGTNDMNSGAETRVLRGGSWLLTDSDRLRAAYRLRNDPSYWGVNVGFRCARSS